jgi:hypothetical protein
MHVTGHYHVAIILTLAFPVTRPMRSQGGFGRASTIARLSHAALIQL